MKKIKNLFRRGVPFLCCLVLLAAMIVPASATVSYDPEGEWLFDLYLTPPPFSRFDAQFSSAVDADVIFVAMVYDSTHYILSYELENGNLVTAWSRSDGWISEDYRSVYFYTYDGYIEDEELWSWFQNNAIQMTDSNDDPFYTTTLSINGYDYVFSALGSSPDVSVLITDTGCTMTAGDRTKTWIYPGTGTFLGFSYTVEATEPTFQLGATLTVPGNSGSDATYSLYSVADASGVEYVCLPKGLYVAKTSDAGDELALPAWPDGLGYVEVPFRSAAEDWSGFSGSDTSVYYHKFLDYPVTTYHFGSDSTTSTTPTSSYWEADVYKSVYFDEDYYLDSRFVSWFTSGFVWTSDDSGERVFTTTVNIYSTTGDTLFATYTAEGLSYAPYIQLIPKRNGLKLVFPDQESDFWISSDHRFIGFSYAPNAEYVAIDGVTGTPVITTDVVVDLYVVLDPDAGVDIDFVSWLATAAGGFFEVEFYPGFSLGDILWTCIAIGVLFAFLKLTT